MKLWEFISNMVSVGGGVSSKRVMGIYLIIIFGALVIMMSIRGDYTLVKEMGILGATLIGVGVLDKIFKK